MTNNEANGLSNEDLVKVFENLLIAREGHIEISSPKAAIEIINGEINTVREHILCRLNKTTFKE